MLPLHHTAEILHARMANYSCKKTFPYALKLNHNTSVTDEKQTDGQQPCQ